MITSFIYADSYGLSLFLDIGIDKLCFSYIYVLQKEKGV